MRHVPLLTAVLVVLTATVPVPARAGAGLPKIGSLQAGPHTASLHNDSPVLAAGANLLTLEIPSLPVDRTVVLTLEGPHGRHVVVPLQRLTVLNGTGTGEAHGVSPGGHDGEHGRPAQTSASHEDEHNAPTAEHATTLPAPASAGQAATMPVPASTAPVPAMPATMAGMDHSTMAGHTNAAPAVPTPQPEASHHAAVAPAVAPPPVPAPVTPPLADSHAEAHVGSVQSASSDLDPDPAFVARGAVHLDTTGSWLARLEIGSPSGERLVGESRLEAVDTGPSPLYLGTTGALIGGALLVGMTGRYRRRSGQATAEVVL